MTRQQVESDYTVVNGRIVSPGMFEGEQSYVPHFWQIGLGGFADIDDGKVFKFEVTPEDRQEFPALHARRWITLIQRDDGFVCEF